MQLSSEDIEKFREIWKRKFNEDISACEAGVKARQLIELFALLSTKPPEKPNSDQTPEKNQSLD